MIQFEDIVRTTRTVIADTNIQIDIDKLFEIIPITDYIIPEKKRGRKKKNYTAPIINIKSGSIISIKYNGKVRGILVSKSSTAFKNSITIVMIIKNKKVNFKLSKNGRFQITGNNDDYNIEKCVKYMWKIIKVFPDIYEKNGTSIKVTFWSSMVNYKFNVGFRLDRQKLNTYINENTEYISVFETSSGSASVNIKMPLVFDDIILNTMIYRFNAINPKWVKETVSYNKFIQDNSTFGKIKNKTNRLVSFLVFHTGEIIITAIDEKVMKPYYDKFMSLLNDCKSIII